MKRIFQVGILWFAAVGIIGCDNNLDGVYEDFRAEAPAICKDYCEERAGCEWPLTTNTGPAADAFASAVRRCTAECAAFAAEGAYVWYTDPTGAWDRIYDDHLGGNLLFDGFSCLYNMGAYRCVTPLGTSDSNHRLNPPVASICEEANNCLAMYGVDFDLYWAPDASGAGGSCERSGSDHIEAIFFE